MNTLNFFVIYMPLWFLLSFPCFLSVWAKNNYMKHTNIHIIFPILMPNLQKCNTIFRPHCKFLNFCFHILKTLSSYGLLLNQKSCGNSKINIYAVLKPNQSVFKPNPCSCVQSAHDQEYNQLITAVSSAPVTTEIVIPKKI